MHARRLTFTLTLLLALIAPRAFAFCGFYVAKGDAKLFNRASQVAIVRDEDRTVMTMANDFQGEPKEFAVVIPVPTRIERGQIRIVDKALIDHLDAYSAPRLVEYFDQDPCRRWEVDRLAYNAAPAGVATGAMKKDRAKSLGVTIEAQYTVGEYDILILSAKQSDGLETWLVESGYSIPRGASAVLGSYIKQNMKFFVAKVNLKEQAKLGFSYLRPIQVAYESPKFMLPIRLGTVNAKGTQELFVYLLTRKGRAETTNYRTVKLPSDVDVPLYVKDDFGPFYKATFAEAVRKEDMTAVFSEYAWDMNWCDPCAADPLSRDELKRLGVFWLTDDTGNGGAVPYRGGGGGSDAFLTRLHVRYDRDHFPEDLVFQSTGDRTNFQARYILRHPWTGSSQCDAGEAYRKSLRQRQEKEAVTLAHLTGWNVGDVRRKMGLAPTTVTAPKTPKEKKWWEW